MLEVTCAIIVHQNKILVTQRNSTSDHPMKWEFPGGKINTGETAEDCIIREIREELEIEIEIQDKMTSVNYDYGFRQIRLYPFLCSLKTGTIKLTDHHDFMWATLTYLEKIDFAEADKKLIQLNSNKKYLKKSRRENMNNS